jgi:hypothetical protein
MAAYLEVILGSRLMEGVIGMRRPNGSQVSRFQILEIFRFSQGALNRRGSHDHFRKNGAEGIVSRFACRKVQSKTLSNLRVRMCLVALASGELRFVQRGLAGRSFSQVYFFLKSCLPRTA